MLAEQTHRDIVKMGELVESSMGIAEGNEAFILQVLRKDLYGDPKRSLMREYLVNGRDIHKRLGKGDVPLEVVFPTPLDPHIRIRDFGTGLDEAGVRHFLGKYGASDKRGTNDEAGFYGFGSKSAFAYRDDYIVEAFKDGVKRTFTFYIDDETEKGKVAKMGEEATNEPDGICIVIPVNTYDINSFVKKTLDVVRFFSVKPTFKGLDYEPTFETKRAVIEGEGWSYHGSGEPLVIMGEIAYPVEVAKMGDLEVWERKLLNSELYLHMPLGSVAITPSRELLRFNEKTIGAIREKLRAVRDKMVEQTQEAFRAATSLFEAKALYHNLVGSGAGFGAILRDAGVKIEWNGEEIDNSYIKLDELSHGILVYENGRRVKRGARRGERTIKSRREQQIECRTNLEIYFDDTDGAKVNYMRRARTLLNAGEDEVRILQTRKPRELEKMLGIKLTDLKSYKAVTPTVLPRESHALGADPARRAKQREKVFKLDGTALARRMSVASDHWTVEEVDINAPGLYLPIERYQPQDGRINNLSDLRTVLNALESLGIKCLLPIYGIKKGGETGNLTLFSTWLKRKVERRKRMMEQHALALDYSAGHGYRGGLFDAEELPAQKLHPQSDAVAYAGLFNEAKDLYESDHDARVTLYSYTGTQVAKTGVLAELSDVFRAKYPMLKFASGWQLNSEEVINYIYERDGVKRPVASEGDENES